MRALLFAAASLMAIQSSCTEESPQSQTLVTLYGTTLGIRQGDRIDCYKINEKLQWQPCRSGSNIGLVSDVRVVASNNRNLIQVVSDKPEQAVSSDACLLTLPPEWKLSNLILGGGYFTECELAMLDSRSLKFVNANQSVTSIAMDCSPPPDAKIYMFGVKSRIAFVGKKKVSIHQILRREDQSLACVALPDMDFVLEHPADEMFIFSDEMIGIRRGNSVHFTSFDKERGQWGKAKRRYTLGNNEVPDFNIPPDDR